MKCVDISNLIPPLKFIGQGHSLLGCNLRPAHPERFWEPNGKLHVEAGEQRCQYWLNGPVWSAELHVAETNMSFGQVAGRWVPIKITCACHAFSSTKTAKWAYESLCSCLIGREDVTSD